jgi:hypothetical protein
MVAADPRRPIECPTNHLNHLTLSSKTPIASVYDLATLITDCCANVFDQYHIPDEFQFLDFFERFIGAVVSPVFAVHIFANSFRLMERHSSSKNLLRVSTD